ncbi:MAG: response regulator [Nitrospirota bacterium]|nr:MAG: response regulator [Nitrospirota bacterium]
MKEEFVINDVSDEEGAMTRRILIVDDEEALLIALKKLLNEKQVDIDTAETLEGATKLIGDTEYDIVIADIRLAGVLNQDGLEILQYVKKHSPDTRVVLMTGYGSPEIMEYAFSLGADFYFEKPVSIKVLKDAIRSLKP